MINVPIPEPGQTLPSIIALTKVLNGWPKWQQAKAVVLGSGGKNACIALYWGWSDVHSALAGLGFATAQDLAHAHDLVALYQPFIGMSSYQQNLANLVGGELRFRRLTKPLMQRSGAAAYCRDCIGDGFRRAGYAFAHRMHQVVGLLTCPLHGTNLVFAEHAREDSDVHQGLVLAGDVPWSSCPLSEGRNVDQIAFDRRYASFVAAALDGALCETSMPQRQAAFLARLKDMGAARTPAVTLTRKLKELVGDRLLRDLGLDVASAAKANWPALVLSGSAYAYQPAEQLLVMATLFADVDDFNAASARHTNDHAPARQAYESVDSPFPKQPVAMPLSLIKDLLRQCSVSQIEKRHNIAGRVVYQLNDIYPPLAERWARVALTSPRVKYRMALCALARQTQDFDRSLMHRVDPEVARWLERCDSVWLDQTIAFFTGPYRYGRHAPRAGALYEPFQVNGRKRRGTRAAAILAADERILEAA